MVDRMKRLPARFYCQLSGIEPVREWLKALHIDARRIIGFDVVIAEFGWPIGMPLCRSLGSRLWEIRSNLPRGRTARIFFCVSDGHMILLHGFLKKTQKTAKLDLDLAHKGKREVDQ